MTKRVELKKGATGRERMSEPYSILAFEVNISNIAYFQITAFSVINWLCNTFDLG